MFEAAQASMAWGKAYPGEWFRLSEEDRAWMLQTYITREQMRAVEVNEQDRPGHGG